jgi:type IV secretory pathway VirB10-like protein
MYTINAENTISAHASLKQAEAVEGAEHFRSEAGLAKLAGNWPIARLVETWNSLPGVSPVKKFKDRPTGVSRIWKAIQELELASATESEAIAEEEAPVIEVAAGPEVAAEPEPVQAEPEPTQVDPTTLQETPQSPNVAPEQAPATKKSTRAKETPKLAQNATAPREGSKTTKVLELMKREGGVTLNEIMATTGWQAHSVRGFISGTLGKKMGLTVVSTKTESGERTYSIQP